MREPGSGARTLTEQLLGETGATPPIGMEIESTDTIKQAVMAGLGIALLSAHTVSVELEDGRLVMLNVVGLPILRQWFVVRRSERRMMPAALMLWKFSAAEGGSFLPELTFEEQPEPAPMPAVDRSPGRLGGSVVPVACNALAGGGFS